LGCSDVVLNTTSNTQTISGQGQTSSTFYVQGGTLYDPCAKPVVLRGVTEMVTFSSVGKDGLPYFPEIAKTGANAVRILWQTADSADYLDRLLTNAEALRLIPLVYVYDTQGMGQANLSTVAQVADFWTRADILPIVDKHKQWLIIVLRDKGKAPTWSVSDWASRYDAAVARVRAAGINVPLVIDAANFGTDVESLLNSGSDRIAADPQQNMLLSINAWNFTTGVLQDALTRAHNSGLPLLVSEFTGYTTNNCAYVAWDYQTFLAAAQQSSTGWFAWSWGGVQNSECGPPSVVLDMTTDGTFAGLYGWGSIVAVSDTNSLKYTAPATYVPGMACP
jgi:mannan endo-1,4-beta-mannosidase